ncbi:unnamed protein product [Cylicocyclus nassatus]|uniref:Uncharacterized protein n=1 Tax=Cylicocyclus nassatus TaxID=53992 RepID=A0AA36GLY9_CYLNA|nr:unnamed protein product [Cylicocyclus nassatus]
MKNKDPIFLDPRETFEHYENRSRPTSSQSFEQPGVLACEYRAAPPPGSGVLGCEYRAAPGDGRDRYYYADPEQPSQGGTKITTYLPEENKRKFPLGAILAVAIGVPVVLVICLFGAVWLQELGIL